MNDDITRLESEIHGMRGDFKDVTKALADLTVVMTRKEENDKFLERRVEKIEGDKDRLEARIRACEDFITKSSPWINTAGTIVVFLVCAATALWLGIKT